MDFKTLTFPETFEAQTEQALNTIESALREAGATFMDVVRVRVYVADRGDVPKLGPILKRRLGAAKPTNTTVCSPLAVEAAKIEIEVTARKLAN